MAITLNSAQQLKESFNILTVPKYDYNLAKSNKLNRVEWKCWICLAHAGLRSQVSEEEVGSVNLLRKIVLVWDEILKSNRKSKIKERLKYQESLVSPK